MIKPEQQCEVRLSYPDVIKAIEDYLNKNIVSPKINVTHVRSSQTVNYLLVAEFN